MKTVSLQYVILRRFLDAIGGVKELDLMREVTEFYRARVKLGEESEVSLYEGPDAHEKHPDVVSALRQLVSGRFIQVFGEGTEADPYTFAAVAIPSLRSCAKSFEVSHPEWANITFPWSPETPPSNQPVDLKPADREHVRRIRAEIASWPRYKRDFACEVFGFPPGTLDRKGE